MGANGGREEGGGQDLILLYEKNRTELKSQMVWLWWSSFVTFATSEFRSVLFLPGYQT